MSIHVPAISVLMAVRNGERFLDLALTSLVAQTFSDFEIVLVNNGSSDRTAQIIAEWAKREPRLRTFDLDCPGLAGSLILAASMARAPFLARLDADDIAMPERLALQYLEMTERPSLGLLGGSVEIIDQQGRRIGERQMSVADSELRDLLKTRNPFCHSTIMMRRDAYERAGGYRRGLRMCEDFDLWCRMSEVTELGNIERPLVRYRIHGTAMSIRQPMRMMIVDKCIIAAGPARRQGLPEPFTNGVPRLRRALCMLNIERSAFLYELLKVTAVAGRLALQSDDRAQVLRLRRRAFGVLFAMPRRAAIGRGLWRMLGMYFRPYSRDRRRALLRRMFTWKSVA